MISGFLVVLSLFSFSIHQIMTLSERIIILELNENHKYKHMFNTLQDSILHVKSGEVAFMNKQASQLFSQPDILTKPTFYLFTDGQESGQHGEVRH